MAVSSKLFPVDLCCLKRVCKESVEDHTGKSKHSNPSLLTIVYLYATDDFMFTCFSFRDEKVVQFEVDLLSSDVLPGQIQLPGHALRIPF